MLTGAKCADWEDRMRKNYVKIIALALGLQIALPDAGGQLHRPEKLLHPVPFPMEPR